MLMASPAGILPMTINMKVTPVLYIGTVSELRAHPAGRMGLIAVPKLYIQTA
jgi:hypothetical protein